ncbi:hypothetical protein HPB47_016919 [Ixodes persulcatus]|uniref:Uncharacterized protein n=1 Tax=Ixodes persulcatus TaxID=34615 RepID=A0AC60R044_IXOPE|nr:hypothetical protein HPB47_016919 [Ixodes persulcatus]
MAAPMETDLSLAERVHERNESEERSKKRKLVDVRIDTEPTTYGYDEENADCDRRQHGPWQMAPARRRRGRPATQRKVDTERTQLQRTVVVIRMKEQRPVTAISKATLHELLRATVPVPKMAEYATTQSNLRTNTIAVTTYNEQHADNLCKVSAISVPGLGQVPVDARKMHGSGTSKGVIALDLTADNDDLTGVLRCEQATILEAKRMGSSDRALITFDTPLLPKYVKYYSELCI